MEILLLNYCELNIIILLLILLRMCQYLSFKLLFKCLIVLYSFYHNSIVDRYLSDASSSISIRRIILISIRGHEAVCLNTFTGVVTYCLR